ncbi:MAG: hypothetical protein EZS28_007685 [Streblomastix strix]|uniref:Uncharacterized protein n=1 Tax=Streblomastix strix TaxID=222440 RepID=A0A5J4WQI5_9EUKA|nr:MAG: hypothetical protein EZS28_007685 [Streblomastix strix]
MKDVITIPTKIVPYVEENEELEDLIQCKKAYGKVIEYKLEKQMKDESKKDISSYFGAKDFSIKFTHTIVLFDDAIDKETSWNENVQLCRRETLLEQYNNNGTAE